MKFRKKIIFNPKVGEKYLAKYDRPPKKGGTNTYHGQVFNIIICRISPKIGSNEWMSLYHIEGYIEEKSFYLGFCKENLIRKLP